MSTTAIQKGRVLVGNGATVVQEASELKSNWNGKIKKVVEALGANIRPGMEISIEPTKHDLLIAKCGVYMTVLSEGNVIAKRCESIEVLDNGWIVACIHGQYELYYKDGSKYRGLSFLKKSNAIRFAKTL